MGKETIVCTSSDFIGELVCEVEERILYISGYEEFDPIGSDEIIIKIWGIKNPNKVGNEFSTSAFKVGIIDEDDNLVEYNSDIGEL